MNILFLDDDETRHRFFQRNTIGHAVTAVRTAEEAKEALRTKQFDVVSLDHDLGGAVFCPSDEHSGWEVARFIANDLADKPRVIVHSFNPDGIAAMMGVLLKGKVDATQAAFGSMKYMDALLENPK